MLSRGCSGRGRRGARGRFGREGKRQRGDVEGRGRTEPQERKRDEKQREWMESAWMNGGGIAGSSGGF